MEFSPRKRFKYRIMHRRSTSTSWKNRMRRKAAKMIKLNQENQKSWKAKLTWLGKTVRGYKEYLKREKLRAVLRCPHAATSSTASTSPSLVRNLALRMPPARMMVYVSPPRVYLLTETTRAMDRASLTISLIHKSRRRWFGARCGRGGSESVQRTSRSKTIRDWETRIALWPLAFWIRSKSSLGKSVSCLETDMSRRQVRNKTVHSIFTSYIQQRTAIWSR